MSRRVRRGHRQARRRAYGLVVEGEAEYHALSLLHREQLIPKVPPLKVRNCGGIGGEVSERGIAHRVHKHVRFLQAAGCAKIVVCIDRERRPTCCPRLAGAILRELDVSLRGAGASAQNVPVVIADRAFESWLLADAAGLAQRGLLQRRPSFSSFEGRLGRGQSIGKTELKALLGGSYVETKHGPELFRHLDFARARDHGPGLPGSRSLDKLLRSLGV